jgi:hypothetical protein
MLFTECMWQTNEIRSGHWSNDTAKQNPMCSGNTLSQCHFVHQEVHMDWPRIGPRTWLSAWAMPRPCDEPVPFDITVKRFYFLLQTVFEIMKKYEQNLTLAFAGIFVLAAFRARLPMASSGIGSESDPSASPSSLLLKSSSSSEKSATRSGNEQNRNGNHSHVDYELEFII